MFMGSSAQNRSANRCPSSSFAEEHFRKPALSLASAHRELHDMAIPGFGEIAEQLRRSTVLIHSGGRGSGSGVICSSNGVLVTNAHVVRSTRPAVQLWDGREFEASVQSRSEERRVGKECQSTCRSRWS